MNNVLKVTNALMQNIADGKYETGFLPPQDVLAKEFSVSRTVLREAISKLANNGVVEIRPKIGTRIVAPTKWKLVNDELIAWRFKCLPNGVTVMDALSLWRIIGPAAAANMHARATSGDAGHLIKIITSLDVVSSFRVKQYHRWLLEHSYNEFFVQMIPIVDALIDERMDKLSEKYVAELMHLHMQLAEVIGSDNPAAVAISELFNRIVSCLACEPRPTLPFRVDATIPITREE